MVALTVTAITTLAAFALKAQCRIPWDGRQYSKLCYNDIQALFGPREIDKHEFPYVGGRLTEDLNVVDGGLEYPVLTGVFIWASGLPASDYNEYLVTSALLLAPFGFLVTYLLVQMAGWRALMWAAAPAFVLYAFHNWDLLAVAAAVAGLWLWWRGHGVPAAVAFGVGGALKIYPLLLLAPLVLQAWSGRDRSSALTRAAAGVGTFVLINLPLALIDFEGWSIPYRFASERTPNYDSIWTLGWPHADVSTLNVVTAALLGVSMLGVLLYAQRRARKEGVYPFLQTGAGLVAVFLLWNKVHSPQYALWILPFFVLLRVRVAWWIAYSVADLAVYIGVFKWFYETLYLNKDMTFFKGLMTAGVWGRAALLAVVIVVFLRARDALSDSERETSAAHVPIPVTPPA